MTQQLSPTPLRAAKPHSGLAGRVRVPGDKSISHRALLLALLVPLPLLAADGVLLLRPLDRRHRPHRQVDLGGPGQPQPELGGGCRHREHRVEHLAVVSVGRRTAVGLDGLKEKISVARCGKATC